MASIFDTTRNYSLYAIPVAWVLSLAPHVYASQLAGSKFDNSQPRGLIEKIKSDQSIDTATKNRIFRAEGAQQNGFENIGLFATAVVAGTTAGVEASTLNWLSGGYLVSRIIYNLIYINNESPSAANARSAVFISSIGIIMTLFVKAGNKLGSTL